MFSIQIKTDPFLDFNGNKTTIEGQSDSASAEDMYNMISKAFVLIALEEKKISQTSEGFPKEGYRVNVDGRYDVGEQGINGAIREITFAAQVEIKEILKDLIKKLRKSSRVDTGQYLRYHALFINSTLRALGVDDIEKFIESDSLEVEEKDKIRIVNLTPYAGMLEREGFANRPKGVTKRLRTGKSRDKQRRSGDIVRQPNGAYFLTARSLNTNNKYRNNALIKFEFVNGSYLPGIDSYTFVNQHGSVQGAGQQIGFKNKKRIKGKIQRYAYPSIFIYVGGGIKT